MKIEIAKTKSSKDSVKCRQDSQDKTPRRKVLTAGYGGHSGYAMPLYIRRK